MNPTTQTLSPSPEERGTTTRTCELTYKEKWAIELTRAGLLQREVEALQAESIQAQIHFFAALEMHSLEARTRLPLLKDEIERLRGELIKAASRPSR